MSGMEPLTAVAETCCCRHHLSTLPSHRTRSCTWFLAPSWRALHSGSQLSAMDRQESIRLKAAEPLGPSYHRTAPQRSAKLHRVSRAVCAIENHRVQIGSSDSGDTDHLAKTTSRRSTPVTISYNTVVLSVHHREYHLRTGQRIIKEICHRHRHRYHSPCLGVL